VVRWHVHSNEAPADADVRSLAALATQMVQSAAARAARA
jgi:hypothetical protein